MDFVCSRCNRIAYYDTEILFCPFCGNSYSGQSGLVAQTNNVRITIGSDSERNIENLYWSKTKDCLANICALMDQRTNTLFGKVHRSVPHIAIPETVEELMDEGTENLCRKIRRLIARIGRTLEELQENPEITEQKSREIIAQIQQEKEYQYKCFEHVSEVFHARMPEEPDKPEDDEDYVPEDILKRYSFEIYKSLLDVINLATDKFVSVIQENDMNFSVGHIRSLSLSQAFDIEPIQLSKEIRELAKKDYDFILGENPVPFQYAFWNGVIYLAHSANEIMSELCVRANGLQSDLSFYTLMDKRMVSLRTYSQTWLKDMIVQLDRIYKNQQVDMMDLYKKLAAYEEKGLQDGII